MPSPRSQLTRFITLSLALVFVVSGAVPASRVDAWANHGDLYGTHDWVIDQAMKVVDGRVPWFNAAAARLVSDDPDHDRGISGLHVYRNRGRRGGAVHLITEYQAAAVRHVRLAEAAQAAGNSSTARAYYDEASRDLGLLSHYYSDVLQPFHSAYAAIGEDDLHLQYEHLVGVETHAANDASQWSSSRRTVSLVASVRTRAIKAAAYSRQLYPDLIAELRADDTRLSARMKEITGLVLKRAANDLADIIYSAAHGEGVSPPVASLKARVRYHFPRKGEPHQQIFVKAKDGAGNPIEGLRVDVDWPLADGGTKQVSIYTDERGKSHWTDGIGNSPLMVKRVMRATATTNRHTETDTTWFKTSPIPADGQAGFLTTINDHSPSVGDRAVVKSRLRDTSGRPIAGIPVTWEWTFPNRVVTKTDETNSNGVARSSYLIRSTTTKQFVTVYAFVQSGSKNRRSRVGFQRS